MKDPRRRSRTQGLLHTLSLCNPETLGYISLLSILLSTVTFSPLGLLLKALLFSVVAFILVVLMNLEAQRVEDAEKVEKQYLTRRDESIGCIV
jgi:hypothetical protein